MDPSLLKAYDAELAYPRAAAREFAEENQEVAGRLGLRPSDQPDPHVERLLEGVAFLAARVKVKLDDQFPEFTQHLLQAVQPDYLAPTPSMCVVQFEPKLSDPALVEGIEIPSADRTDRARVGARHAGDVPDGTGGSDAAAGH